MRIPPILRYEFLTIARNSRTYLVRGFYLAILVIGLTVASYSGQGDVDLFAADRARQFFTGIWQLEVAILFIVVPVIVISAITREKERDTLGLLMMSGLNGLQIIIGKVAGRLMYTVFLLLAGVPVLIAMQSLGGITATDLIAMHIGLLAAACLQAGIAVFCAARAHSMAEALGMTVLIMLGLAIVHTVFILAPAAAVGAPAGSFFANVIVQATFPLISLPSVRPDTALAATITALVWCLGLAVGFVILAAGSLRMTQRRGSIQFLQKLHNTFDQMVTGGSESLRLVPMHRKIGRNPILWREAHKQALAHTGLQIRLFYILLIPAVVIVGFSYIDRHDNSIWVPIMTTTFAAAMLFVIPVACFSFASERSRGRFAVLLTTPMPSWKIVVAKWWGATKSAGAMLGLTAAALFMMGKEVSWLAAGYYAGLLSVFLLLVVLDGLTGSLKASSAPRAMAYGIIGLVAEALTVLLIVGVVQRAVAGGLAAFSFAVGEPEAWIDFVWHLFQPSQITPTALGIGPAYLVLLILALYLLARVWYFLLRYERWLLADLE